MLDIGWPELLVVAVVLIVVVGPKDLPGMLRGFGRTTKKMRAMATDFRRQFDDVLEEAELSDVKNALQEARSMTNPREAIKKHLNPLEQAGKDIKAGLDEAMKPTLSSSNDTATQTASENDTPNVSGDDNSIMAPDKATSQSDAAQQASTPKNDLNVEKNTVGNEPSTGTKA